MTAGREGKKVQHKILIRVIGRTITLGDQGEKYAMAAQKGSDVIWYCNYPFSIMFEPGSHFRQLVTKKVKDVWTCGMHVPNKSEHFMYKYTIAVAKPNGGVLIMDPVLVPIPPEN